MQCIFAPNLTATVNSKLWWCRLLTYREVERWRHRDKYRRHISASATVSRDLVIPSSPVHRYQCITDKRWTTATDAADAGALTIIITKLYVTFSPGHLITLWRNLQYPHCWCLSLGDKADTMLTHIDSCCDFYSVFAPVSSPAPTLVRLTTIMLVKPRQPQSAHQVSHCLNLIANSIGNIITKWSQTRSRLSGVV